MDDREEGISCGGASACSIINEGEPTSRMDVRKFDQEGWSDLIGEWRHNYTPEFAKGFRDGFVWMWNDLMDVNEGRGR